MAAGLRKGVTAGAGGVGAAETSTVAGAAAGSETSAVAAWQARSPLADDANDMTRAKSKTHDDLRMI